MFKVNNKNTRTMSLTPFGCFYCWLWTYFTLFSSASIVDFEQVNISWVFFNKGNLEVKYMINFQNFIVKGYALFLKCILCAIYTKSMFKTFHIILKNNASKKKKLLSKLFGKKTSSIQLKNIFGMNNLIMMLH